MFYYFFAGFTISTVLLTSSYFYVGYSFNKLDRQIEIPNRQDKPLIKSEQRNYILPKSLTNVAISKPGELFFEVMVNLDWENIPVPKIEGNETAKQTMKIFYERILESTGIIRKTIPIHNDLLERDFGNLFKKFIQNNGGEVTERICREHKGLIGHEYIINSEEEINFFQTESELKEEYIKSYKYEAEKQIKAFHSKSEKCSVCPQEEIIISPPDLFYTTCYDSNFQNPLTSFTLSHEADKPGRLYNLVGLCIFNDHYMCFIAVLVNTDYYCRNLNTSNLNEKYQKGDLNGNLKQLNDNYLSPSKVYLIYARSIF